jgi:hypothetical protein
MSLKRCLIALCTSFCLAGAASAVPSHPGQPTPDPAVDVADEMAAYGAWLARLLAIEEPVEAQFAGLDPTWRAAFAQGGTGPEIAARLRPIIARALAEIDAANPRIDALELPQSGMLGEDEDLQPAAIAREVRTLNLQLRDAMTAFYPLIDAIEHNDHASVEAAGTRVIASFALVLETKILLARASLAATPRDDASWSIGNVDLITSRVGARMFSAWRPFAPPRVDPSLPRDLDALADELDSNAVQGGRQLDATIAEARGGLADAEHEGDRSGADVFRRVITMFTVARDYLGTSRDLVPLLRAEAEYSREHAVNQDRVMAFFGQMQAIRERMAEIERRMVAAMATAQ